MLLLLLSLLLLLLLLWGGGGGGIADSAKPKTDRVLPVSLVINLMKKIGAFANAR